MLLPWSDILDVMHRKCSNTHYSIKGYPLSTLFTHHPAFCAEAHQPTPIAFLPSLAICKYSKDARPTPAPGKMAVPAPKIFTTGQT